MANYVGINNVAKKIVYGYVGINNTAKKILKGYVGINNVAKLIKFGLQGIYFDASIAPASSSQWVQTATAVDRFTATNEYGTWECTASSSDGSNWSKNAFVNSTASCWVSIAMTVATARHYCQLNCPVQIKPLKITVEYHTVGNETYVQGYDDETDTWENLGQVTPSSSNTRVITTLNITPEKFYSKFRVYGNRTSSTSAKLYIYRFLVEEGFYVERR